ncbi:MAG: hypothetical protein HQK52_23095 [Oligoflexia bacterium]|nr:hypothetical protein [Oligoflexia bacterium]
MILSWLLKKYTGKKLAEESCVVKAELHSLQKHHEAIQLDLERQALADRNALKKRVFNFQAKLKSDSDYYETVLPLLKKHLKIELQYRDVLIGLNAIELKRKQLYSTKQLAIERINIVNEDIHQLQTALELWAKLHRDHLVNIDRMIRSQDISLPADFINYPYKTVKKIKDSSEDPIMRRSLDKLILHIEGGDYLKDIRRIKWLVNQKIFCKKSLQVDLQEVKRQIDDTQEEINAKNESLKKSYAKILKSKDEIQVTWKTPVNKIEDEIYVIDEKKIPLVVKRQELYETFKPWFDKLRDNKEEMATITNKIKRCHKDKEYDEFNDLKKERIKLEKDFKKIQSSLDDYGSTKEALNKKIEKLEKNRTKKFDERKVWMNRKDVILQAAKESGIRELPPPQTMETLSRPMIHYGTRSTTRRRS